MTIKALDANNDIFLQDGQIHRISEAPETIQQIRSRLLFYLGEWFLDATGGVDYFGIVFVKPVNLSLIESELKSTIINTDGVLELNEFELDYDSTTRKLIVDFEAETIFGTINVNEVTING